MKMFIILSVLIALASAGAPSNPAPRTRCDAKDTFRADFLAAQTGSAHAFFSDTPDMWGYTSSLAAVPFDENSEAPFYFSLVDYICAASRPGCNATVTSLKQRCTAEAVFVDLVIDVTGANTFISTLTWKDYVTIGLPEGINIIYGCRLNQDTKEPSTTTAQSCANDAEWESWLATSSGRFAFTYKLTGATCTCDNPDDFTNYNYDLVYLSPWDNDVSFSGSGHFNSGAGEWAGVSATHFVKQALAGQVTSCGPDCYLSSTGMANIGIHPEGDYLELRRFLKGPAQVPALGHPPPKPENRPAKRETRASLKKQAVKK